MSEIADSRDKFNDIQNSTGTIRIPTPLAKKGSVQFLLFNITKFYTIQEQ